MNKRYKFIYLLFSFLLLSSFGFAQKDITSNTDSVYISGSASDFEIVAHITVYNNSTSKMTMGWEKKDFLPADWSTEICDINQCYGSNTTTAYFDINAGDSVSMEAHFKPNNSKGAGKVVIHMFDKNGNYNDGIDITYFADAFPASVSSKSNIDFRMYPSPVRDYLTINFSKKGTHEVEVYNILGRRMLKKKVDNSNSMMISFTKLQSGMYIILYRASNGGVITKTISKD